MSEINAIGRSMDGFAHNMTADEAFAANGALARSSGDILSALRFVEQPPASPAPPSPLPADVPYETPAAVLELRQIADPAYVAGDDPEAWHLPPPGLHTTGSALRRRLVTSESIAELAAMPRPGLIQRLFGRH